MMDFFLRRRELIEAAMAYRRVEYIQASTNRNLKQCIDLGIQPSRTLKIQITISDFTPNDSSIFGAKDPDTGSNFQLFSTSNYDYGRLFGSTYRGVAADRTAYQTIIFDATNATISTSLGGSNTLVDGNGAAIPYNIVIFGSNNGGTLYTNSSFKLYALDVWDNNIQIRRMRPYLRADDKPGMLDELHNVFYINQGSGEFNYGNFI